jgi:hypothetical protein
VKKQIIFFGVDGSGKSTLIREVLSEVNSDQIGYFHLNFLHRMSPSFVNKTESDVPVIPYSMPPYGFLKGIIKEVYLICVYCLGASMFLFSKSSVIYDRFLVDIIVDPERVRLKKLYLLNHFFTLFFKKSSSCAYVFTHCPEAVLSERKSELTLEKMTELNEKYSRMSLHLNPILRVATDEPLHKSKVKVLEFVNQFGLN